MAGEEGSDTDMCLLGLVQEDSLTGERAITRLLLLLLGRVLGSLSSRAPVSGLGLWGEVRL